MLSSRNLILILLAVPSISACLGGEVLPGPPSAIQIVEGAGQVGRVGTRLPIAPQIRVIDHRGKALPKVTVQFSVSAGFGSVTGATALTDSLGLARVGSWTLGGQVGEQKLAVQVKDLTVSAEITATATTGPAAGIIALEPTQYAGMVGTIVTNPPTVQVSDAFGNPQSGVNVTFVVVQGGGTLTGASAVTNPSGQARVGSWRLGSAPGINRVEARIEGERAVSFEAQALGSPPTQLVAISPVDQPGGIIGFQVAKTARIQVRSATGQPLYGIPVSFALTGGGDAMISGTTDVTDVNGIASLGDWRLGTITSSSTVRATLPDFPGPSVSLSASGVAKPFQLDLRILTRMPASQRDAVVAAAARWMTVVTDSLPTVQVNNLPAGRCGQGTPSFSGPVKNLILFAQSVTIDGRGGVIASAGPCVRRTPSLHTAIGSIRIDNADADAMDASGRLFTVVLHEMGHVFGFGTSWTDKGLVSGIGTSDPIYHGGKALALWPRFEMNYSGSPIPLETQGGSGTKEVHWRKSVFGPELMTGYVEPAGIDMPLSRLTIAVLEDFGYRVNYNAADSYRGNLFGAMLASSGTAYPINEELQEAVYEVNEQGELRPITTVRIKPTPVSAPDR